MRNINVRNFRVFLPANVSPLGLEYLKHSTQNLKLYLTDLGLSYNISLIVVQTKKILIDYQELVLFPGMLNRGQKAEKE